MKTTILSKTLSGILMIFSLTITAQTGIIKGTIKTSDGNPAEFVSVGLKGTDKGAMANAKGEYEIKDISPGSYTLVTSFVGLESKEQQVEVIAGQTIVVNFVLSENSEKLQDVIIKANVKNKFRVDSSNYLSKLPLKDMENPQVYDVVTLDLMEEQQVTNFNEAMNNVTGVTPLFTGGGDFGTTFSSRGFATVANLRNGVSNYNTSDIDPANIQEIEVLKGPAGTLFGSPLVSWGGLINIVTKQPYDSLGGEASYTAGSYGLSRFTADINVPLSKDSTVLFRLNAAHTYQGSFQDAGFTQSTFLAPSITYKPNKRLTISVEGDFYERQGTSLPSFFIFGPMDVSSPTALNLAYNRSFTSNNIVFNSPTTSFFGQINYKLSGHWTSQTILSTTIGINDGPYQWDNFSSQSGDSLVRTVTDWTEETITTDIQQNFISDYTWGKIRNRLITGLDFYNYYNNGSYYYVPFDTVSLSNPGTEYTNLTPSALSAKEAQGQDGPYASITNEYTYAAYISDVFNLTDNLIINAGLRVDHFDDQSDVDPVTLINTGYYQQTALSPKFGIVFQPVKNKVALFADYSSGFQNNSGIDFYGKPFKPSYGNQFETGVKLDILKNTLSATISYYNIYTSDLLLTDPEHPGFSLQGGTLRTQGTEASIIAVLFPGFNIVAGYSYNYKQYEVLAQNQEGTGDNSGSNGNTVNFYASYHLLKGKAKGLGFSFGGNYAGPLLAFPNGSGFTLPAYTILNASVFYDKPKYRLGFKVNNITNQEYWIGWYDMEPQMLRNISAELTIKF